HFKAIGSPFSMLAENLPSDPDLSAWVKATFSEWCALVSPISVGAERFVEILSGKINAYRVGVLHALKDSEHATLLATMTHLEIAAGTKLSRKGDWGKELSLIIEGVAEVRMPRGDSSLLLATLGRGDIFGEMSFVSTRPRSADVIAHTPLEVIYFDDD